MKAESPDNKFSFALREFQTIVTISYVLAVGVGMMFSFQKFSEFGINIFNYADVFDFLIAPFSDLRILYYTLISISLVWVIVKFDLLWKKKFPKAYSIANFGWDKKPGYEQVRIVSFLLLFISYLYYSADYYGRVTKELISNQEPVSITYVDNAVESGIMIGKTNEVVFLLKGKSVKAIPITSLVKEIEIK